MNEVLTATAVIAAGAFSGFLNTLASSGSAVSLPVLIFLGLSPSVANGTNRLAIIMGAITGTMVFQKAGVIDWRRCWIIAIPVILGTILGAQIASILPSKEVAGAIIIAVIMALILILTNLKKMLNAAHSGEPRLHWFNLLLFFIVGLWTGFIVLDGATYMLLVLALGVGYDLTRANALKVVLLLFIGIASILVFSLHGQINWYYGALLGAGSIIGAWVGGLLATKPAAKLWISRLLIVVISLEIIQLLIKYKIL